nr:hypothetical protein [Actinomadura rayongensis]
MDQPGGAASAVGRHVGRRLVADLQTQVHQLRLADDILAGHDLLVPAFRALDAALHTQRETLHNAAVGRGILSAVGEFAQIAGWVASDAGEYRRAEGAYRLGADAAREARDPALESHLVGSLAYQITNVGDPADGVKAALASVSVAESSGMPRARALARDRLAWAHARTGDAEAAQRALGEAGDALAAAGPANDDPDYLYWVNADELRIMEARVYTELHRPLRAIPLLVEVLETYEATHAREVALYMSWLAIALADANEIEEAATVAARMLELSSEIASERTAVRARVVAARLARHRDVPAVAAVLEAQRGRTRAANPDSGRLE